MHQTRTATRQALTAIAEALTRLDPHEWDDVPERELIELLLDARKAHDRLTGVTAALLNAAERRNAAILATGMPLPTLLGMREHRDGKDTRRTVFQGRDITKHPFVAQSVLDGSITPEHAQAVTKVMNELPRELNREQTDTITKALVTQATQAPPSTLPAKAKEALAEVAPHLAPTPEDEDRKVARQRLLAMKRRSLVFGDDDEGSIWFKGSLPYLEAESLLTCLDRSVAAQKRAERDRPRRPGSEPTREQRYADALAGLAAVAATAGSGGSTTPNGSLRPAGSPRPGGALEPGSSVRPGGSSDPRISVRPGGSFGSGSSMRPGDSLGPAGPVRAERSPQPGGSPEPGGSSGRGGTSGPTVPSATIVVTISERDLLDRATATGLLPSGRKIPAGELRRLLCTQGVVPMVLGSHSEILDMGRETRFVTAAQRRALTIRDGGCVFPGCTVGDPECHAHHVTPWWQGGRSDLENLILLCPYHHAMVEPERLHGDQSQSQWQVDFDPQTRKPILRHAAHGRSESGDAGPPPDPSPDG
ncbi:MAG: DUF222 domain-containing protein [Arachnia sp.]